MNFVASLLIVASLVVVNTSAFAPVTPLLRSSSPSSTLRMVADDAKVILVTGSSRGLGKSIALELGKAGQKVVVNYVSDSSKESADATVEEIKSLGGDAIAVQADSKKNKNTDANETKKRHLSTRHCCLGLLTKFLSVRV